MTRYGTVDETLERYRKADKSEWRLLPQAGSTELEEIKLVDIPRLINDAFFIALRFWRRYQKFGISGRWKDLTVAQIRVIELFDDIMATVNKRGINAKT